MTRTKANVKRTHLDDPPASPHGDERREIAPRRNLPSCSPVDLPVEERLGNLERSYVVLLRRYETLVRRLDLADSSIRFLLALEDDVCEGGIGEVLDELEGREDLPWEEKEPS